MTNNIDSLILGLPLKQQDSSLLAQEIMIRAQAIDPFQFGSTLATLESAIKTAAFLHRTATRSVRGNMPRTHYIEHPLRNAVRLLRYGVDEPHIIIAAVLHDTLEDCATEITYTLFGLPDTGDYSEEGLRRFASLYLTSNFGYAASSVVRAVSNPIYARGLSKADKRVLYAEHVEKVIDVPDVFLVKFADFVDNAVGLHHNAQPGNEGMVEHLAAKYLPLVDIFQAAFSDKVKYLVSEAGAQEIQDHLDSGRESLTRLSKKAA